MLIKAMEWRDRLKVLLTETDNKEYVQEHIEILEYLIDKAGSCNCNE